jgi:hypothetical protein
LKRGQLFEGHTQMGFCAMTFCNAIIVVASEKVVDHELFKPDEIFCWDEISVGRAEPTNLVKPEDVPWDMFYF